MMVLWVFVAVPLFDISAAPTTLVLVDVPATVVVAGGTVGKIGAGIEGCAVASNDKC